MSVLTAAQQKLYDAARGVLPKALFPDEAENEVLAACAKQLDAAAVQMDAWFAQSFITRATGFWLDGHASDRGTFRQNGESDAALAARLRLVEPTVTKAALLQIANAVLAAAGVVGTATILELRSGRAFYGTLGGRSNAFFSRGYRYASVPPKNTLVVMLPYGTSAATAAGVGEALRIKKAAGVAVIVEVRGVP